MRYKSNYVKQRLVNDLTEVIMLIIKSDNWNNMKPSFDSEIDIYDYSTKCFMDFYDYKNIKHRIIITDQSKYVILQFIYDWNIYKRIQTPGKDAKFSIF